MDSATATPAGLDFDLAFSVSTEARLLVVANANAQRVFRTTRVPAALDAVIDAADISMLEELTPTLVDGSPWSGTIRLRATALGQRKLQAIVTAQTATDGPDRILNVVAAELTRPDQVLAELAHRATHDYLTGLPNRALLLDRLTLALARARRHQRPIALMFIDLDNFKLINDRKGHTVGDAVLVEAAQNMSRALRPSDTIARMGGDEFVVLCSEVNQPEDAEVIATRIRAELEMIPHPTTGQSLTASFGVIVSMTGDIDTEELLVAADRAMYQAKAAGTGHITGQLVSGSALEITPPAGPAAVEQALTDGSLLIGATPVIDVRTGFVAQVEVLPLWQGYTGNRYDARELISASVDSDLCALLDTWSIQAAMNTHTMFTQQCGARAPRVTTRISAATPLDERFRHQVRAVRQSSSWNALGIELDPAALSQASTQPAGALGWLDDAGVALTAATFGSGATPLAWLANSVARAAKVSFDPAQSAAAGPPLVDPALAITALVNTARSMNLSVIATEVATQAQLDKAMALGCDAAQGALFGQFVEPALLVPLIDGRHPIDFW